MYDFIRIQYVMGKIDEAQVRVFVPHYITQDQADEITGKRSESTDE